MGLVTVGRRSLRLIQVSTGETTLVAANGYALLGSFSSNKGRFVFMSAGQPTVLDLATGVVTRSPYLPAASSRT